MERKIGFIGLGYAGFPMAYMFSRHYKIIGYDCSAARIAELNACRDHTLGVAPDEIRQLLDSGSVLTDDPEQLRACNFYIITVPTPVDEANKPDFACLLSASRTVGSVLGRGDIVVYESTVNPGATEEVCVPALEAASGLSYGQDFAAGYSPERVNPGDPVHTPRNTVKVVSASTPEALAVVREVYGTVVGTDQIHAASSIKVAEACKVLENTQRDINIALMNEAAKVFAAMNINTGEVIDAMNTKWNALGFRPGLVGGHCISVDPYYLIEKAAMLGVDTRLMSAARHINNSMADFVARHTLDQLIRRMQRPANTARVLLLGLTYKENCPDIRNTKVKDIYDSLASCLDDITVLDPWADPAQTRAAFGIDVVSQLPAGTQYDAILLCVSHDDFLRFDFRSRLAPGGFVYDIKGVIPPSTNDEYTIIKL
ncbi:MAG: nucleotide sugar dehydrogenase [Prevotellaceae bacterium]|nr:nucleotide sugar dehydrogenase [Prevotellaceae bacterium]